MRVSVVIPTYRRPELLRRCLDAVLAQRFDAAAFEVVVCDDGHDDATRALVESMQPPGGAPLLRYLRPAVGRGPAVARNAGWRAASGALIAFTDDDTIADPGWLAAGERAMAAAGWSAVCGAVQVPAPTPPTDHELMTLGLAKAEFVTANAIVRRSALEAVGGFDERFTRAWREDSDLQFRLMAQVGPVGRAADAVVAHPVRSERWGISLRQQRNAFFEALLFKKHPRLYRERIDPSPPWHYYAIVAATAGTVGFAAARAAVPAAASAAVAAALVCRFAARRLQPTARNPGHVVEMLATSALIPFLSVYWRLRGALHFGVRFW